MLGWLEKFRSFFRKNDNIQSFGEIVAPSGSAQGNDMVRDQLLSHGDDGSKARPIEHWAYPDPANEQSASYDSMAQKFEELGLSVESALDGGCKLSETKALKPDLFDDWTQKLANICADDGWEYDGWETEVVRPDEMEN